MQARLLSNVETWRLPEARWQRRVVVRSSRLLRFWVRAPNTNSEIGTTRLARARARGTPVRKQSARSTMRHAGQWWQIQEKAQDYSGSRLKPQTPTPK